MKDYRVKEIFVTLQGEGFHAGRKAVFVRLSGCNLGYDICPWCDTDWVGGSPMTAPEIAQICADSWGPDREGRWCVLTGGEPTLQADAMLVEALHHIGFYVQIETNGTRPLPLGLDWVTVSPKAGSSLYLRGADELKVAFPQGDLDPESLDWFRAPRRYLQPIDVQDPDVRATNRLAAVHYCLEHPEWRLSIQVQKVLGIP